VRCVLLSFVPALYSSDGGGLKEQRQHQQLLWQFSRHCQQQQ